MNQIIQKFDQSLFSQIPLYKSIFNPFLPLGFQNKSIISNSNIKYFNLKVSVNLEGFCEYIYGYNEQILDVICCVKNIRYRFILPEAKNNGSIVNKKNEQKPQKKEINNENKNQTKLIEIKNKLLIIEYKSHVFIHDLVRHNNRLIVQGLKSNQLIQNIQNGINMMGVCSLNINEHYIYRIISNNLARPLICLQLFNIDMANNLNVVLVFNKVIKITQKQARLVNVSATQNNFKLVFSALVEEVGYNRKLTVFEFVKQNINYNGTNNKIGKIYKLGNNQQLYRINISQADQLLVNLSKAINGKENTYQSIANSWIVDRYSQKSNISQSKIVKTHLKIVVAKDRYLVYSAGQCDFILIFSNINQQFASNTKLIQHECPIIDMIIIQHKIYVLDQQLKIWVYQFKSYQILQYQPIFFGSIFIQKPKQNSNIQYQLLQINQNLGIITQFKIFTLQSQLLFSKLSIVTENELKKQYEKSYFHNDLIRTFLSVQSQQYTSVQIFLEQSQKQKLYYQKFGVYLTLTTDSPFLNIQQQIINQISKINHSFLFQNNFSFISQYQIQKILLSILKVLNKIKIQIQGSIYDCYYNQYYWLLSSFINNQRNLLDMKIAIVNMIKNINYFEILQTLLNQFKMKNYLLSKCQNIYPIACTTYFGLCKLQSGCSCPFKRLLYLIMKLRQRKLNINFVKSQQIHRYNKIQNILVKNQLQSKLQIIVAEQEEKIKKKMQKQFVYATKMIDKKWDNEFPNSKKFKSINDNQFKQITQRKTEENIIIDYRKSQRQLNQMYGGMISDIAQKLLGLKYVIRENILNEKSIKYFQEIYNICKQNQLLYFQSKNKKSLSKINAINDQERIKLCIIAANQVYEQYLKQLNIQNSKQYQVSFAKDFSRNITLSEQDISLIIGKQITKCNLYRKNWILISQLICQAFSIKYIKSNNRKFQSQLQNLLLIFIKSMGSAKYIPHLVQNLKKIISFNIISQQQLKCFVQCILKTEMYRFDGFSLKNSLLDYKFRYSQQIWTLGIQQLLAIFEAQSKHQI